MAAETQVVKQYRSIMYYRSLAVQKMAGVPGTAAKIQRMHSMAPQDNIYASSKNFTVADLEGMGKAVQKVFLKSAEYSVLESVGEARWARGERSGGRQSACTWHAQFRSGPTFG